MLVLVPMLRVGMQLGALRADLHGFLFSVHSPDCQEKIFLHFCILISSNCFKTWLILIVKLVAAIPGNIRKPCKL